MSDSWSIVYAFKPTEYNASAHGAIEIFDNHGNIIKSFQALATD